MARKQVLQINKFSGGVNSYSDPRDLEENEFQILDNASVDEEGVIRVSGGLEVKNNIDISSIGDSLYLPGEGLFGYSTDYYEPLAIYNTYLEANGADSSTAWGVTSDTGSTGGTWEFGAIQTNDSNRSPSYFGIEQGHFAINYIDYSANTLENHGSLSFNGLTLKPGHTYNIRLDCVNENPWYFLGSNIPPRVRLYNDTLGKYLTPDSWSPNSDATHNALISTDNGNLVSSASVGGGSPYWNSPGGETISRTPIAAAVPVASSAAHKSYASFFGNTDIDDTVTDAYCLKVIASANGGPLAAGNFAESDAITVLQNTTYLLDCIYNTNGTTGTNYVGIGVNAVNGDTTGVIVGSAKESSSTSQWAHINAPLPANLFSTPTPIEFTTPNNCTSIKIRVGPDNTGGGTDYAYFSGFNLRKKTYELIYLDEVSSGYSSYFSSYKHPNSWGNEYSGDINSSPYLLHSSFNSYFGRIRKYSLSISIPQNFDESNDWVFSLENGIWSGLNQLPINNFIVSKISIIDENASDYQGVEEGSSYNLISQSYNSDSQEVNTNIYNYNPIDKLYNRVYELTMPSLSSSCFRFVKGSKYVYFCDKNFGINNLFAIRNNYSSRKLEVATINYVGPGITDSTSISTLHGINPNNEFDVVSDYLAKNTNVNDMYLSMLAAGFLDELLTNNYGSQTSPLEHLQGIGFPQMNFNTFNQYSGNVTGIDQDVIHGSGSGLYNSTLKGFKYDMDDGDWKHSTNPYTKFIVIQNDDIVGTGSNKLLANSRIARVKISLSNWIAFPRESEGTTLGQDYIPNMKIYLDVVNATAADSTFYSVPGDANFIKTIGEIEVNPNNHSVGLFSPTQEGWSGSQNQFYSTDEISWGTNDPSSIEGWSTDPSYHHSEEYTIRYKTPNDEGINYDTEYNNITIDIPYTMTDGSNAITVHGSTGVNLQLRFVPKIDSNVDLWHMGNGSYYFSESLYLEKRGILSEEWLINKISLQSYLNNDADTEDSFAHINTTSIQANVIFETPSTGEADGWDDEWRIHLTSVDSDDIESAIGNSSSKFFNTDVTKCPRIDIITDISNSTFNSSKFIKGYMTSTRNDNYNLQFIIDCNKKTIKSSTSGEEYHAADFSNIRQYTLSSKELLIPNEIDSYESETGILIENALNPNKMLATFKTAVIAKNTMYAGNVYQDGVSYPDRMLKSPIGKAPLLPSTNFIDVAVNDGDEIVSLQFYKDKLLQFKKSRLYVISTSEDYEFLEDTIENVGIVQDSQVTMTPHGVAWVNPRGCYLYDGSQIKYLSKDKLAYKKWKDSESSWEIDEKYGPVIHYLKKDDKLIIYGATDSLENITSNEGLSGGDYLFMYPGYDPSIQGDEYTNKQYLRKMGYQYDFNKKSWSQLTNYTEEDIGHPYNHDIIDTSLDGRLRVPPYTDMVTNFAYDENGDSILLMKPLNIIARWDDNPKQTMGYLQPNFVINGNDRRILNRDFRIITKDYDFGAPSVKKKIYKVYVTFKSTDLESHKSRKLAQNQDYYSPSRVGAWYAINGTNTWTEFSLTKSINYGTKGLMLDKAETLTTLIEDVSVTSETIRVESSSNIKAGDVLRIGSVTHTVDSFQKFYYSEQEQMLVLSVDGTYINVRRNYNSTLPPTVTHPIIHNVGQKVYISNGDWNVAELKPDSSINNIDSFKLRFSTRERDTSDTNDESGVPPGFMINDISVIYRTKNVR